MVWIWNPAPFQSHLCLNFVCYLMNLTKWLDCEGLDLLSGLDPRWSHNLVTSLVVAELRRRALLEWAGQWGCTCEELALFLALLMLLSVMKSFRCHEGHTFNLASGLYQWCQGHGLKPLKHAPKSVSSHGAQIRIRHRWRLYKADALRFSSYECSSHPLIPHP